MLAENLGRSICSRAEEEFVKRAGLRRVCNDGTSKVYEFDLGKPGAQSKSCLGN